MRKFLLTSLLSSGLVFKYINAEQTVENQYDQISRLIQVTGDEELIATFKSNDAKVKELLADPEKLSQELNQAIDVYLNSHIDELTRVE